MTKKEIQKELEQTTTSLFTKGYQVSVAKSFVFSIGENEDDAASKLITEIKANLKHGSTYPLVFEEVAKVDRIRKQKKKEEKEEELEDDEPIGLAGLLPQNLDQ
jgi:hypothetical protein